MMLKYNAEFADLILLYLLFLYLLLGPENKEFPTFSDPQFLFTQIEE